MPSPAFRINGGSAGVKASVSAGATVTATLDSTDGVRSVQWSVIGTDETRTAASYTLTPSGSVGQSVALTAGVAGTAGILRCQINGGINLQTEQADATTRATGKWYVPTSNGYEVGCVNEQFESDETFGWAGIVNTTVRGAAAVAASGVKEPCRAATTAALPANSRVGNVLTANANGALPAQDLVTLAVGDRLLVKNEGGVSPHANNGPYAVTSLGSVSTPWVMTRTTDADASAEVFAGMQVYVQEGTTNAQSTWVQTATSVTLNTTQLAFTRQPGAISVRRTFRVERAADVSGSTTTSERSEFYFDRSMTLLEAWLVPDADMTVDDAAYGGIQVASYAGGSANAVLVECTTTLTELTPGVEPTGDWSKLVPIGLTLLTTTANAGEVVALSVTKTGSKQLPRFTLFMVAQPA